MGLMYKNERGGSGECQSETLTKEIPVVHTGVVFECLCIVCTSTPTPTNCSCMLLCLSLSSSFPILVSLPHIHLPVHQDQHVPTLKNLKIWGALVCVAATSRPRGLTFVDWLRTMDLVF